ncbi:MAG: hypothetical protein SF052_13030 [Bacteroidia bacterium]|nr:hypothetical protein [Bacteroidia bacterium]
MNIKPLRPEMEQEIIATLIYKGKIAAIRMFMEYTECRLRDAKAAVEKIGREIQPGQAS